MNDPMPTDIFQVGQVLNNTYEIEGILGRGGTGEVYRARNQINDRIVAIKALSAQFSGNADYVELIKREEEMRNIVHSAVVRYVDCSRTDEGRIYLVMDYVEGPSLNEAMLDRRLDPRELLIVAHRVAEGLEATHAAGIIHRDLSPDNVILRGGAAENATIIDFGIAKDTAAGARTIVGNDFAGKYEYAAPEQLEGHADPRTDLYSLGATILAAFRGDVPFHGSTPGEIVRRKQAPLDTEGVPAPLKSVIDRLTAPRPDDRPSSAADLIKIIDELLTSKAGSRISSGAKAKGKGKKKTRGKAAWLIVPIGGAAVLALAWTLGAFDTLLKPPLPVASPYSFLAAIAEDGAASLVANAPDEASAEALRAAYAAATGNAPQNDNITLATGVPFDGWPASIGALLRTISPLVEWDTVVRDVQGTVTGLAPDTATRDAVSAAIRSWSEDTGIGVDTTLIAGPRILDPSLVQGVLDTMATCGPLGQDAAESYGLFETITITGDLATPDDAGAIEATLGPLIGDRTVRFDTTTLNPQLCAIRGVLPTVPANNVSLSLVDGDTGEPSFTGVFTTGENPVVDILVPADVTRGSLWVMVVDVTGKVFHILPNINRTNHDIADLGTIEGGVRRVRVLFSIDEFRQDTTRLAMRVTEDEYGKSEVIAILSTEELFDIRRPRDESVISVAEALAETLDGRDEIILGVASRIIDARE